jgi:hypothetical protein
MPLGQAEGRNKRETQLAWKSLDALACPVPKAERPQLSETCQSLPAGLGASLPEISSGARQVWERRYSKECLVFV